MSKIFLVVRNWLIQLLSLWALLNISIWMQLLSQDRLSFTTIELYPKYFDYSFLFLLAFLLVAELNYQYIFQRYRPILAFFSSLAIGVIFTPLVGALVFPAEALRNANWVALIPLNALLSTYIFLYGFTLNYFYKKSYEKDLRIQRSESELNALKSQLNPHFLFNTLNYLYGTAIQEDASRTASGIEKLSSMMRYLVTGMKEDFVLLSQELRFIEEYISLQKVRLAKQEALSAEIPAIIGNQKVAPLILIPFIENAFKYGISIDKPWCTQISINVDEKRLIMTVENDIVKNDEHVEGSNTGIINTRKRLDLLYFGKYKLVCGPVGLRYRVELSLDLD